MTHDYSVFIFDNVEKKKTLFSSLPDCHFLLFLLSYNFIFPFPSPFVLLRNYVIFLLAFVPSFDVICSFKSSHSLTALKSFYSSLSLPHYFEFLTHLLCSPSFSPLLLHTHFPGLTHSAVALPSFPHVSQPVRGSGVLQFNRSPSFFSYFLI